MTETVRQAPKRSLSRHGITRVWVVAAPVAAIGPYLIGGVRTEQLYIYLSALAFAFMFLSGRISRMHPGTYLAMFFLFIPVVVATGGLVLGSPETPLGRSSALGNLDSLLIPIMVILITWAWSSLAPTEKVRSWLAWSTLSVIGVAGVTSLLHMLAPTTFDSILAWFVSPGGYSESVSSRAASIGRYGGIFNQPAEAGIAFSLGVLLGLSILVRRRYVDFFTLLAIACTLLAAIGGITSDSKIFLLVGLPLSIAVVALVPRGGAFRRFKAIVVYLLCLLAAVMIVFAAGWTNPRNFGLTIFNQQRSLVDLITAGRFGTQGGVNPLVDTVASTNPIFGLGARGIAYPSDSLWGEYLVVAGLVGVASLILLLVLLVVRLFAIRHVTHPDRVLAGVLLALLVGASFGISSINANRAGLLLWAHVSVLLVVSSPKSGTIRIRTADEEQGKGAHSTS